MNIELDEETVQRLRKKAEETVLAEMVATLRQQVSYGQMVGEVRNKAVAMAASTLAERVANTLTDKVFDRAMQSVQGRVNTRIHELLKNGILVRFANGEPDGDAR
jgi:hypothetical protein